MRADIAGASMGPGCFHPRNDDVAVAGLSGRPASMGPGCFHPRNETELPECSASGVLQWGRDVSIPEMWTPADAPPSRNCFNGAGMFPSQKFRERPNPEMSSVASMGPGCFHPRNTGRRHGSQSRIRLQWGRDVSIPEIALFGVPRPLHVRLQWGRDVSIPEMLIRSVALSRGISFNGAGMFPSQKSGPEIQSQQ